MPLQHSTILVFVRLRYVHHNSDFQSFLHNKICMTKRNIQLVMDNSPRRWSLKNPIKLKENPKDGQKAPVIKMIWILISASERFLAADYHTLKTTEALLEVRQVRGAGSVPWEIPISLWADFKLCYFYILRQKVWHIPAVGWWLPSLVRQHTVKISSSGLEKLTCTTCNS